MVRKLRAKARGAVREAATIAKGHKGIFARLARDHGELVSLIEQGTRTMDVEARDELIQRIRAELRSHLEAEEATLYEALEGTDEMRELIQSCREDHQAMLQRLDEVLYAPGAPAQRLANLERLRDALECHFDREEEEVFPRGSEIIVEDPASRLGDRFVELKQQAHRRLTSEGSISLDHT